MLTGNSGLATSLQNLSLLIFPLIVAWLVVTDPTYYLVEMFFFGCNFVGILLCIWMYYVDKVSYGGRFEKPEKTVQHHQGRRPSEVASPRYILHH